MWVLTRRKKEVNSWLLSLTDVLWDFSDSVGTVSGPPSTYVDMQLSVKAIKIAASLPECLSVRC
jgi:hypothetical protein